MIFGNDEFEGTKGYQQQQLTLHHHKRESVSDEADSKSGGEPKKLKHRSAAADPRRNDGATIEVARRPRGRPPGSKNRPKPPTVITREADPASAMRPHVLEVAAGHDVVESLARLSGRRGLGLCVLSGNGSVSNVVIRQPTGNVVFRGQFDILSLSAAFFPPSISAAAAAVTISLAGPQGQIMGGVVSGPLVAAGPVTVVAAAFSNPTFHRLPSDDDDVPVSVSGGVEFDHDDRQQQQHRHQHHSLAPAANEAAESCGMAIYSCQLPTDVMWPRSL